MVYRVFVEKRKELAHEASALLSELKKLLGIDLGIFFSHGTVAVADRNERHTDLIEVSHSVVGNVPAEHAVPYFVIFVADMLPLFRREAAEWRQIAMLSSAHGFELAQCLVDF